MFKYAKIYGGSVPTLEAKSANEIMLFLNLKTLLEKGLLKETLPDKLTSPKQKYIQIEEVMK